MTTMWTKIFQSPSTKAPTDEQWNGNSEKYFGLENFGNTCYCNSILQTLYFCKPFRECVINFPIGPVQPSPTSSTLANGASVTTNGAEVKVNGEAFSSANTGMEDTLFGALKDLFIKINGQKKRSGVVTPHQFVAKLKSSHVQFQSTMHQDAHEFFNWILNVIIEHQKKLETMEQADTTDGSSSGGPETSSTSGTKTWVHKIFEGVLTNEIKCLTCETITSKDETFFELPLNIEQNSSVTSCLRKFSASEMLRHRDKFFCDACCGLQEAEKRMKIKKLPNVLALHLKRFKVQEFQDKLKKVIKLSYRVVFPFELRLFNTCDDIENPDRLYELYAVCVHIGSGLQHGHYVALIKSMGQWRLFDDDAVEIIDEEEIQRYSTVKGSGYMLFYQAVDLDYASLGLPTPDAQEFELSEQQNDSVAREPPPSPAMTNGTVETVTTNGTTLVSSASSVTSTATVTFSTTNEPSTPTQTHDERHQPPVRENSSAFAEWSNALLPTRRRKDHNTPDRRKSHGDHENSKDNDSENHTDRSTSWLTIRSKSISHRDRNKDKDKDKDKDKEKDKDGDVGDGNGDKDKRDEDDKKRSSQLDPVPEIKGGKEGGPSKKDKKIEKEEKKKEKKQRLSEKYKFSTSIINGNGYQAKPAST